jgi:competence protein ComGA
MSIEQHSEKLLLLALSMRASDIHFVPKQRSTVVQVRVSERLLQIDEFPLTLSERIISHFKFLAGMDIGEKRRPQNGSLITQLLNQQINLRISTLPTANQESMVLRILPQTDSFHFSNLSLFPCALQEIYSLIQKQQGLILFSGPTGSGKTTMLYSLLAAAQEEFNRQIITLEDPVEKKVDSLLQIEINEKAGITYHDGFKSILRHDPDVIMIGEIRDVATARLVIRASMTGHLVLSTMHAKSALGCLYRLFEFGVTYRELSENLLGVVTQQLVELSCPYCEGECSSLCYKYRKRRRMGLYEQLSKDKLQKILMEIHQEKPISPYVKLNYLKARGIAFGYIPQDQGSERNGFAYD